MKCYICGSEIPEGKKYCPGCGRVVSKADIEKAKRQEQALPIDDNVATQHTIVYSRQPKKTVSNGENNAKNRKTTVYRPASSKNAGAQGQQSYGQGYRNEQGTRKGSTSSIPDIFSSDPNAPEYTDPHAYDRATADVINYDRTFMQRSGERDDYNAYDNYGDEDVKVWNGPDNSSGRYSRRAIDMPEDNGGYYDDGYRDDEVYPEDEYDEYEGSGSRQNVRSGSVTRGGKESKPHLKINVKAIFITVVVIAAIVFCVMAVYQIGKKFEFWGGSEDTSQTAEENEENTEAEDGGDSANGTASVGTETGVYTVSTTENNIFMYKSKTGDTIFATIPNETVIEITEIYGEYGKTTYNSRTGWVKMEDLEYTPDSEVEEAEDGTTGDDSNSSDSSGYEPGEYVVDTQGSGYVNVRSEAGTTGEILTTVTDGQELTVDEVKSGWGHITVDGIEGWIYMNYLTAAE
ncbi:MAG: SH3 domain-containing protein [Clostridiales bacterium]|nr:SH3 domain-containing protein [Clostridiales bacterium]